MDPIPFPEYGDSTVLYVHQWRRVLAANEGNAIGNGDFRPGAYTGYEVLTATDDAFDDLTAWLQGLLNRPPSGYRVAVWGNGIDEARMNARSMGVDFGVFASQDRPATSDVLVVTLDPDVVQRKAGLMLSLLGRFRLLPPFFRSAVDAQAKAQTGFTVSEALDPSTPIGVAFDALQRLHDVHARGVVFVDSQPERR